MIEGRDILILMAIVFVNKSTWSFLIDFKMCICKCLLRWMTSKPNRRKTSSTPLILTSRS